MARAKAKPIGTIRRGVGRLRRDRGLDGGVAAVDANGTPVQRIEHQGFLLLLTAVTLAFAWVLYPFYGAVLWAIVVAVLFAPVYRWLLQPMQGRPSLAAALTGELGNLRRIAEDVRA
jgi:hypothetical protein